MYYFDIKSKRIDTLTTGNFNEKTPSYSPDGRLIAFASNRSGDPDKNENTDIYVAEAKPGAAMKRLTSWAGSDTQPKWSPDGESIAYLQSSSNEPLTMYGMSYLAVISKDGGEPTLLSKQTDRPVHNIRWNKNSKSIAVLLEDDRQSNIVSFEIHGGQLTKITEGNKSFSELVTENGKWLAAMSEPQLPTELFAIENNNIRRRMHVQDSFLAPL